MIRTTKIQLRQKCFTLVIFLNNNYTMSSSNFYNFLNTMKIFFIELTFQVCCIKLYLYILEMCRIYLAVANHKAYDIQEYLI